MAVLFSRPCGGELRHASRLHAGSYPCVGGRSLMGASSNHLWTLTPPCFTLRAANYGGSFFSSPVRFSILSSALRSGRAWLPARDKAMQARPRPSSSPATRSQPLACDFLPDKARDDLALGPLGRFQHFQLVLR